VTLNFQEFSEAMMTDLDGKTVLVVRGLTPREHQSLLYEIDEEAIGPEGANIPSTAMGDMGATALAFLATAALIAGVLKWVERQNADIELSFEIYKFVSLKVKKGATKEEITRTAAAAGLPIEPSE
jgi:hypothetical protein